MQDRVAGNCVDAEFYVYYVGVLMSRMLCLLKWTCEVNTQ